MPEDLGKNIVTPWYWKSWHGKTSGLTWAERGLWMHLIEQTYTGKLAGHYDGVLMELTGGSVEETWKLLCSLAVKKIGDIEVRIGAEMVRIGIETMDKWARMAPDGLTVIHVYCQKSEEVVARKMYRKEIEDRANRKRAKSAYNQSTTVNSGCKDGCKQAITTELQPNKVVVSGLETGNYNRDTLARACAGDLPSSLAPITPPNPPPDGEGNSRPSSRRRKTGARVKENTDTMIEIGAWFGRRATTLWSVTEAGKLKELDPPEDEVEIFKAYYASEHPEIKPYLRQNLETLLNNWTKDLDKARRKLEEAQEDGAAVRRVHVSASMPNVGVG